MLGKQHLARRRKLDEARAALQDFGQGPYWHWSMGWLEGRWHTVFLSACGLLLPRRYHATFSRLGVTELCPSCDEVKTRDGLYNGGGETVSLESLPWP